MGEHLCPTCGTRIYDDDKRCPVCGSVNYKNEKIFQIAADEIAQQNKKLKKFSKSFCAVFLIIGLVLAVANLAMFFVAEYSFLKVDSFIGAIAGAVSVVFSIVGLTMNEDVTKIAVISAVISTFLLLTSLFIFL